MQPLFSFFTLLFALGLSTLPVAPASSAATPWAGNQHAVARLIAATEAAGNQSQIDAGLQIRLERGWHAYWRNPGAAGIPPSIDWTGSRNVGSVRMYWPAPHRYRLDGLVTQGYENGVLFPLTIMPKRPGQPIMLRALVHYSACKTICIPYTAKLALALPAGLANPGPQAPLIAQAWKQVPGTLAAAGVELHRIVVSDLPGRHGSALLSFVVAAAGARFDHPDIFIQSHLPGTTPGAPWVRLDFGDRRGVLALALRGTAPGAIAGMKLRFVLENAGRSASFSATPAFGPAPAYPAGVPLLSILGIALLGGLILNVMPCVLPVLSLKLMSFAGAGSGERRDIRIVLLATAAGILASYVALASGLVVLKLAGGAIGWGIQFQQPLFLGAMASITALLAASLWDWVPIPLPGFAAHGATVGMTADPRVGAFLAGAFATLLATSCVAPFVGTAVGFALAAGPATILSIFVMLGFGMALPYLLVAAFPGLVRWIPKPGRWMVVLRAILGFALFGTSVWLVSIVASVVSAEAALATGALLLLLLALLFRRSRRGEFYRYRRMAIFAIVGVFATAILTPVLLPAAQQPAPAEGADISWQPFGKARIISLVRQKKLVFVDVTAAWCLICKVNALTVLDRDPVARRLRAPNVVPMRADWTRPSAKITAYLESFGRYGVPLDVVYGPGAPAGIVLPSILTSATVMRAFARAAAPSSSKEAKR